LGAQGVDTGTRGTIYFDDFESRRFSEIGLLPDPGIQNPTPTPVPGWDKPYMQKKRSRGSSC